VADTHERIPRHLKHYVVEQDYAAYDEVDQAVWRFVLLQTYARLCETAHPAYVDGLAQTGIGVDRIPEITAMDRCLSEYGWGAVAVDGFIPPRAFQEFQALGIMTIAADIRRPAHLAYTPAPDIIHESAGHSPIIPDPGYREYLRRFGAVGARAFSLPADRQLYEAVHRLSEVKESVRTTADELAAAEAALAAAEAGVTEISEAALLSRLHWWTVEYGLVGSVDAYRIYGAGLLSSLGESHFCHDPKVEKRPLSAACVEYDYDITRPQPQLFVAESFAQLTEVLDEVAADLAQNTGGVLGLERAVDSGELATVELNTGLQVMGVLDKLHGLPGEPAYLQFRGPCALGRAGRVLEGHASSLHAEGYGTPLGRLENGDALSALPESDLQTDLELCFQGGVEVAGRVVRSICDDDGRLLVITLSECFVRRGNDLLFHPDWGIYDLAVGEQVRSVYAGPADLDYFPGTEFSNKRCPVPRERRGDEARLLALYRRALHLWERPQTPELVAGFEAIAEALQSDFPDDWLLRWNLLECLCKLDKGPALANSLRRELLDVETRFPDDAPITTGLRFLSERYPVA
jgi:phenylalanine-4-hydroxylase